MNVDLNQSLKAQCAQLRSRCTYTSTSLFIWLRTLRVLRVLFICLPIVFGALATWQVLKTGPHPLLASTFALLAGIIPAIYSALKIDDHLTQAAALAGEYKNLELLFGLLENVASWPQALTARWVLLDLSNRLCEAGRFRANTTR